MNAGQIEFIASDLDTVIKPYFKGVFALDNFIAYAQEFMNLENKNVFIFNSQPVDEAGDHWLLATFGPGQGNVVFFDSFANPPDFYSSALGKFLGDDITTSPFRIQGDSRICGLYCILIARVLCSGGNAPAFIEQKFSSYNLTDNDESVIAWISTTEYGDILRETCRSDLQPCLNYQETARWKV